MKYKKPILVTGSPRSGSTWVGKMIANSSSVLYIDEPFLPMGKTKSRKINVNSRRIGVCGAKFDLWFKYITEQNEADYYKYFNKTSCLSFNTLEAIKLVTGFTTTKLFMKSYWEFFAGRLNQTRPLFKDPIAVFSAEWLAQKFNMDVIVTIRHPLAFVGSLKKANWKFDLSDLVEQPLLFKDYLYPFEDQLKGYDNEKISIIDNSILLWKLIYYVIAQYQKKYKNWIFVRHEDISQQPIQYFEEIFQKLKLQYTDEIRQKIVKSSSNKNSDIEQYVWNELIRDSKKNLLSYKNRLNPEEIDKVLCETEEIAKIFYSQNESQSIFT
ncbi:MAG: sulfotransferase [Xenococcus sp. (in: cyanobacteria)]